MKQSIYNYIITKNNKTLIYNTLKRSCVILNNEEYNIFKSYNVKNTISKEFYKLGFWIDDDVNELDIVSNNLYTAEQLNDKQIYKIYTTIKCNAHCYYCFEQSNIKNNNNSTNIEDIYNFIKSRLSNKTLVLVFFGGEPLMNIKLINELCSKLKRDCEEANIDFYSKIISNGYLFNDSIIDNAINIWNLKVVQISLDGMNDYYEKIKRYKDPNSFSRVINNIKKLSNKNIIVNIRLNYCKINFEEVIKLIHFLGIEFSNNKNISVYANSIFDSLTKDEKDDLSIIIFDELYNSKLIPNILETIRPRSCRCVAFLNDYYAIYTDKNVGKCSRAISDGDFIGTIDKIDQDKIKKWRNFSFLEKCKSCKCLPLCNGGCIYDELNNKDNCEISEKLLIHKLNLILDQN